eukprot:1175819-Prorocentrum_minimum.AAC.3
MTLLPVVSENGRQTVFDKMQGFGSYGTLSLIISTFPLVLPFYCALVAFNIFNRIAGEGIRPDTNCNIFRHACNIFNRIAGEGLRPDTNCNIFTTTWQVAPACRSLSPGSDRMRGWFVDPERVDYVRCKVSGLPDISSTSCKVLYYELRSIAPRSKSRRCPAGLEPCSAHSRRVPGRRSRTSRSLSPPMSRRQRMFL